MSVTDEANKQRDEIAPSSDEYPYHRDQHDWFRDYCMLYGDFNRPVLLEEILLFIGVANRSEVSEIRRAVQNRTKRFKGERKKGRPAAEKDWEWMSLAQTEAWRMYALGWDWKKVVEAEGVKPTETSYRTLQRRLDRLAGMLYGALPQWARGHEILGYVCVPLEQAVSMPQVQQMIRMKIRLPFQSHPDECRKVVLGLIPRGRDAYDASLLALFKSAAP